MGCLVWGTAGNSTDRGVLQFCASYARYAGGSRESQALALDAPRSASSSKPSASSEGLRGMGIMRIMGMMWRNGVGPAHARLERLRPPTEAAETREELHRSARCASNRWRSTNSWRCPRESVFACGCLLGKSLPHTPPGDRQILYNRLACP